MVSSLLKCAHKDVRPRLARETEDRHLSDISFEGGCERQEGVQARIIKFGTSRGSMYTCSIGCSHLSWPLLIPVTTVDKRACAFKIPYRRTHRNGHSRREALCELRPSGYYRELERQNTPTATTKVFSCRPLHLFVKLTFKVSLRPSSPFVPGK